MSNSDGDRPKKTPVNAFRASFLGRLTEREETASAGDDPALAGDWQVREHDGRYLLLRDWEQAGVHAPPCWFTSRERALLAVGALAAAARDPLFDFGAATAEGAFPIILSDGGTAPAVIGENRIFDPAFVAYLHAVEMLKRTPRALGYVGAGASGEALKIFGEVLEHQVE